MIVSNIPAGPALDWLTHQALGHYDRNPPPYSTEWAAGGELKPLLENSGFVVAHPGPNLPVIVTDGRHRFEGDTALEAMCRAVISLRIGIDVPMPAASLERADAHP
jgi:hypothetical protein